MGLLDGTFGDANSDEFRHQDEVGRGSLALFRRLLPWLMRDQRFQMLMNPAAQAAIQGGLAGTGAQARKSRVGKFNARADESAGKAASRSALYAKEEGLGAGGGIFSNVAQDAARQKNSYFADEYSPQGMARDSGAALGMFGGYNQATSGLRGDYNSALSAIFGQPLKPDDGLDALIGQAAGMWASGGFKTGGKK